MSESDNDIYIESRKGNRKRFSFPDLSSSSEFNDPFILTSKLEKKKPISIILNILRSPPVQCSIVIILISLFSVVTIVSVLIGIIELMRRRDTYESFLWFSDIHYEPFYNETASCFSICRNEQTVWKSVPCGTYNQTIRDVSKSFGRYGCNTPLDLLRTSLNQMKAQKNSASYKFAIYSGDLVAHGIPEIVEANNQNLLQDYSQGLIDSPSTEIGYYDVTLGKRVLEASENGTLLHSSLINGTKAVSDAIQTVVDEISKAFDDIPVFLTVGNCDVVHDYQWTFDNVWIETLYSHYKRLWNHYEYVDSSDFVSSKSGAYVVTQLPNLPDVRLISFNSLLFSPNLPQTPQAVDRAKWQLKWIENQLQAAKNNEQQVYLLYHIPVGANAFEETQRQWIESYEVEFLQIAEKYRSTIIAHLCGHFHFDVFKILGEEQPFGTLLVSPSISPFFFNNPSYRIFRMSRKFSMILDYFNYFIDLEKQDVSQTYVQQYRFRNAYNLESLSIENMYRLYQKLWIHKDFSTLASYSFRRRAQYLPKSPQYMCSMRHQSRNDFQECVKKQNVGIIPDVRLW